MRPFRREPPPWSVTDAKEIEKQIIELRKAGKTQAEIGLILRDRYGVPDVKLATGKRIGKILEDAGLSSKIPEDLRGLIEKAITIRKHLAENPKDLHNKRQLQLTESKVRRLVKYYLSTGKLPEGWTYTPESAEILLSR